MKTYYVSEFNARRPATVAAGLVLTAIGIILAFIWGPKMTWIADWHHILGMACALLFVSVFLGIGLFLLRQALKGRRARISVTSEGISYGGINYSWKQISEIGVMRKYATRKDLFCVVDLQSTGGSLVVELLGSEGLSGEQIEMLFDVLTREVIPVQTHLRLTVPAKEKS